MGQLCEHGCTNPAQRIHANWWKKTFAQQPHCTEQILQQLSEASLSVGVGWRSGKALHCRCQSKHQMKLKNSDYTNVFPKFHFQPNQYVYFQKHSFLHLQCEMHLNKGGFLHSSPQHYLTSSSLYDLPFPNGLMLKIHFRGWEKRKKPIL